MTFNNGQWTEARFHAFIKNGLRSLSMRWPPKYQVKKEAQRGRGKYLCAGFRRRNHIVGSSFRAGGRRVNNVFVDHIEPVINPQTGWQSWDEVVKRMFVDSDGLQVLCKECHDRKTKEERNSK